MLSLSLLKKLLKLPNQCSSTQSEVRAVLHAPSPATSCASTSGPYSRVSSSSTVGGQILKSGRPSFINCRFMKQDFRICTIFISPKNGTNFQISNQPMLVRSFSSEILSSTLRWAPFHHPTPRMPTLLRSQEPLSGLTKANKKQKKLRRKRKLRKRILSQNLSPTKAVMTLSTKIPMISFQSLLTKIQRSKLPRGLLRLSISTKTS